MNRLALIVLLGLMTGTAHATFELQDPASQVYEEQEQEQDSGPSQEPLGENPFCVIEFDNGQCFCIHKETKKKILLSNDECVAILSRSETTKKQ